jgi:RNA polymerase sigma factor for flagellar operon FliA
MLSLVGKVLMGSEMTANSKDKLLKKYEKMVETIADVVVKRYKVPSSIREDMIASGYLALVEALNKYDNERAESFKGYLLIRIRGAMIDSLRKTSLLSGKANRFIRAWSAMQLLREEDLVEEAYLSDNDKDPLDNLAKILEFAANGAIAFRLSMEEVRKEVESIPEAKNEIIDDLIEFEESNKLKKLVRKLPEKERHIIEQHYFEDKSFVDIATTNMGMTKSWISKLHSRGINQLREQLNEQSLA